MENPQSIKISGIGKEFIKQIQINRIKLDLEEVTQVQTIELIAKYFKNNNDNYVEMLRGETNA